MWPAFPDGVTVARQTLNLLVLVRIQVRERWPFFQVREHCTSAMHGSGAFETLPLVLRYFLLDFLAIVRFLHPCSQAWIWFWRLPRSHILGNSGRLARLCSSGVVHSHFSKFF